MQGILAAQSETNNRGLLPRAGSSKCNSHTWLPLAPHSNRAFPQRSQRQTTWPTAILGQLKVGQPECQDGSPGQPPDKRQENMACARTHMHRHNQGKKQATSSVKARTHAHTECNTFSMCIPASLGQIHAADLAPNARTRAYGTMHAHMILGPPKVPERLAPKQQRHQANTPPAHGVRGTITIAVPGPHRRRYPPTPCDTTLQQTRPLAINSLPSVCAAP